MPAGLVWLGLILFARVLAQRNPRPSAGAALALWLLSPARETPRRWRRARRGSGGYAALEFGQGQLDAVLVLGGGVEVRNNGPPTLTAAGDRWCWPYASFAPARHRLLLTRALPLLRGVGHQRRRRHRSDLEAAGRPRREHRAAGGAPHHHRRGAGPEDGGCRAGLAASRAAESAWHLPRAMRLCRRYGVEAVPLPADAVGRPPPRLRWLVPQQDGFQSVQTACWEVLGALAGR